MSGYCAAQHNGIKSLIVAEYRMDSLGTFSYTYLVRYNFQQGQVISKDTILGAPVTRKDIYGSYVRFDLGRNFIYNNRYVISGTGNVIDIKTKSLVIEDADDFIAAYGDSLIFHRDNLFTGTGYLLLKLKTQDYRFIKDKSYRSIKGLLSPDLKHGIMVDRSNIPYKILLCNSPNACKTIVDNCGSGTKMSHSSNNFPEVATLWIDNSTFVYANHSSNLEIRKVNIETKTDELLGIIDSVPPAFSNSHFSFDPNNALLFTCSKGTFMVAQNAKSLLALNERNHGNYFKSDLTRDKMGVSISYKNEIIGKLWCNSYKAATTTDYFAVEYGETGSNLAYPKGFMIWSVENKKWETIDIPWLCTVIGWTE